MKGLHCEHAQSKNQVVILGISIFEKLEKTILSNHSADRDRKKICHPTLSCCLGKEVALLDLILAAQACGFIMAFTMLWVSKNKGAKSAVSLCVCF